MTDDACLFCIHPRSAHSGCPHHPACCAVVDCTCISFAGPPESADQGAPASSTTPILTDVVVQRNPDGSALLILTASDHEVTSLLLTVDKRIKLAGALS